MLSSRIFFAGGLMGATGHREPVLVTVREVSVDALRLYGYVERESVG